MTRTARLLLHGTGAVLILALIAAPVWDAWRYRDMRSGVSPSLPLAILLAPERGRAPGLATMGVGPVGGSSMAARSREASARQGANDGSAGVSRASGGVDRWSPSGAHHAALDGVTASPLAETQESSDAHAAVAGGRSRGGRDSAGARKPGRPADAPRDPQVPAQPNGPATTGSAVGSAGSAVAAVLPGTPAVPTDARSAGPTPPTPPPPPPTHAAGSASSPGDPGIAAVQAPEVSLLASDASLAVGDQLTLTVSVKAGDHVTSLPFHLMFDPAVLEFSSGSTDPSLGSRLQPVLLASVSPNRPGDLAVGLSFIESSGPFNGSGDVVVLHFRAIGSGDTDLEFSRASLRGATSQPMAAAFHNARVSVH